MTLLGAAVCVHVLAAVLGMGQVAAIVVVARAARHASEPRASEWSALNRFVRTASWSLALLLASGVLIDAAAGGAFHRTAWFRIAFCFLLVLGFLASRARRALGRGQTIANDAMLDGVERIGWSMCGVVAATVLLMVLKPG
jgi:hypothetical protein